MKDLTVFILPSNGNYPNSLFIGKISKMMFNCGFAFFFNTDCENSDQVSKLVKMTTWYMIVYDNEIITPPLIRGMKNLLQSLNYDVYSILKREINTEKIYEAPRIYRSWIKLQEGSLLPVHSDFIRYERVLDGFIIDDSTKNSF